jgi:flagellar basal-body rod protein FlgF
MNRGIYATATGMVSGQKLLDVIANNLANANTTGFKRDGVAFNEALERGLRANGGLGAYVGKLGSGSAEQARYTVFEPGPIHATGNPLDVAIETPRGLFAVQTPQGIRYTRDGAFSVNQDGLLVTKAGDPVLDDALQPIQLPPGSPKVTPDGSVSVEGKSAGKIGVFDGEFTKIGDNLYEGSNAQLIEGPRIAVASLESSNVNPVEAMIQMISVNRAFELAQKSIQQQDELAQKLIQSLQGQ